MKIEVRDVQVIKKECHYIASDGTDFISRYECEEYERKLHYEDTWVIKTSVMYRDFWTDNPAIIYHIVTEEDWNILVDKVWKNKQDLKKFSGGTYYIAVENDDNTYTVMPIDKYVEDIHDCFNTWVDMEKKIIGDLDNL